LPFKGENKMPKTVQVIYPAVRNKLVEVWKATAPLAQKAYKAQIDDPEAVERLVKRFGGFTGGDSSGYYAYLPTGSDMHFIVVSTDYYDVTLQQAHEPVHQEDEAEAVEKMMSQEDIHPPTYLLSFSCHPQWVQQNRNEIKKLASIPDHELHDVREVQKIFDQRF
jgi:hypothetical protein